MTIILSELGSFKLKPSFICNAGKKKEKERKEKKEKDLKSKQKKKKKKKKKSKQHGIPNI